MESLFYYECKTKGNVFIENYITILKGKYPEINIEGIEYEDKIAGISKLFIKSSLPLENLYVDNNYYDYIMHSDNPGIKRVLEEETIIDMPIDDITFNYSEETFNLYINQIKRENENAFISGTWDSESIAGKIESDIPFSKLNHPGYNIIIDKEGYIGENRNTFIKYIYRYYPEKHRFERYPELYIDKDVFEQKLVPKQLRLIDDSGYTMISIISIMTFLVSIGIIILGVLLMNL